MTMNHPGLPLAWAVCIMVFSGFVTLWALRSAVPGTYHTRTLPLPRIPVLGALSRYLVGHTGLLLVLKTVFAGIFLLVIVSGLWGIAIPERNLATTLTWNLWWTGVVIAIVFTGSAWCALCPWDTIASWLTKYRLWQRSSSNSLLRLKVPRQLRNLWPAMALFVGLTWLELGVGITASPYGTAVLALSMVLMATLAMVLFENKAFCRYFCPVGRTIGVYSQLAPIALRPVDDQICDTCETLDCFHGSPAGDPKNIASCPTLLVMGRLRESTYCTSCGNCTQSCPSQNINWALRAPSVEAIQEARPHFDEAFFMLTLLVLTSFHGVTMLADWQFLLSQFAQLIGDSRAWLVSFTFGLLAFWLLPIGVYSGLIWLTSRALGPSHQPARVRKMFCGFAFSAIPLAFSYHIAHNLNHLLREGTNWLALARNPLGVGTGPLSMAEKHQRMIAMPLSEESLFTVQALIMALGFYLALQVIRYRGYRLFGLHIRQLKPVVVFVIGASGLNLWLLMQDMVMRM
jgi:polyferredoxin